MFTIVQDIDEDSLEDYLCGGAEDTMIKIMEHDKLPELGNLLEDLFTGLVHIDTLNDFLWHEAEFIYELLGIETDV